MIKNLVFILLVVIFSSLESRADIDFKKELSEMETIGTKKFNADEKADLIFIDFWASWCDPCRESFPYYEEKIKAQKKKKILFISVNLDDTKEKANGFLKNHPQSHVTIWDEKKKLMEALGFDSIPFLVILDSGWKEKEKIRGFNEKTKKRMNKYF